MRKLYSLLLLTAALVCLPWSMKADAKALPYSYGFEDYPQVGWTLSNPSGLNSSEFVQNGTSKRSGSYGIQFSSYSGNEENTQYLITPELDATNGVNVSFYYKPYAKGYSTTELFKVGYSTKGVAIEDFTFGGEIQATNTSQWTLYEGSFPAGTKYVAVYYYSTYKYYLFVDDFTFEAPATCPKPSGLAINDVIYNGATATWTAGGTETKWQLEYSTDQENWTENIVETTPSYEFTDLTPATKYYVRVKGICEVGDTSAVSDIKNFTPDYIAPSGVEITAKTATTATISWTANSGESAWTLQYKTASVNDWTNVEVTTKPYTLTGLEAATNYQVRVVAGTKTSSTISFQTDCEAVEIETSIKWTFEDQTADAIATCWDNSGSTSTNSESENYYVWGVYSTGSNKMIRMCNYYVKPSGGSVAQINTPSIVLPASPAYELAFDYSHTSTGGVLKVKVSEDGGANWTEFETTYAKGTGSSHTDPGEFTEATIDLKDYASKTIILQFYAPANYGDGAIFVDNVEVRAKSSCPAPKNVLVSNVTKNAASVAWTEKGSAEAWNLQISEDGTNWTDVMDGEEVASITTNPYTLTGLSAETTYYVRVKADCGDESNNWSDPSEPFDTKCEAKAIGYSEFFAADIKPACWTIDNWSASDVNAWTTASTSDIGGSGYALRYNAKSLANAAAVMPEIFLEEKAELKFYVRNYYYTYQDSYISGNVHITDGVTNKEVSFGNNKNLTLITVDLSKYEGKNVTITFNGMGASTYYTSYIWIDSVTVDYLPVAAPTALAVEPGNESAVVTWERAEEGAKDSLRYRVNGSEDEWTKVANIAGKTYTIDGLTNGTTYEVQVKTVASANRQSAWTASASFTPQDCPSVSEVTFGTATYNSVVVNWTTTGAGTWDLRYKQGDLGWNASITNIEANTYKLTDLATGSPYTVQVKPSCGNDETWVAAATTFTPSYTAPVVAVPQNITDAAAEASWLCEAEGVTGYEYVVVKSGETPDWTSPASTTEKTVALSSLEAGTAYVIYVRATYPNDGVSEADDESFSTITVAPKNLEQVGESTTDGASFQWAANGAATNYQWSTDNTNWSAAIDSTHVTLKGLNSGSSYTFYVRSYYSETVQSAAISLPFNTQCGTLNLPWEGKEWEGTSLPNCWYALQTSDGAYSLPTVYSGELKFYGNNSSSNKSRKAAVVLPKFAKDIKKLQIVVKYQNGGGTTDAYPQFIVGYVTDPEDITTFTAVQLLDRFPSTSEYKTSEAIELSDATENAHIAIAYGNPNSTKSSSLSYPNGYIKSISVSEIPTCKAPKNLAASTLYNGATLTWTAGNEETAWVVEYATTSDFLEVTAEDVETTPSLELVGLTTGTKYYARVKASCGEEEFSAYSDVVEFTPNYSTPGVPVISSITETSASATWEAAGNGATGYEYVIVEGTGDAVWTSPVAADERTASLSNLDGGTQYTLYVRAKFGAENRGEAVSKSFTTSSIAPSNLTQGATDLTSAVFTWDANGSAAGKWEWKTSKEGSEWTVVEEATATATDLSAGTTYTFYVRTFYGDNKHSAETSKQFSTECGVVDLGLSESFTASTLPTCWSVSGTSAAARNWAVAFGSGTYHSASYGMQFTANTYNASGNTGILATPSIKISEKALLRFWWKDTKGATFEVRVSKDGGETITTLKTLTATQTSWKQENIDLSEYVDDTIILYFYAVSNATSESFIYVDDIEVIARPCLAPSGLTVSDKTANGATFTWTPAFADVKHEYCITYKGEEPADDAWRELAAGTTTLTTELLKSGTEYDFFIRSLCGEAVYSDAISASFKTEYSCFAPASIAASDTTAHSVVITWTASGYGESKYQYAIVPANSDALVWSGDSLTGDLTHTFEGLDANTAYDIYVRSYCGTDDFSEAVKFTIQTECDAVGLPFEDGFENGIDCWTLTSCHANTGVNSDAKYEGSKGFRFYYNSNPPQYLISPELEASTKEIVVEFYYKNNASYSTVYEETFEVGYSTTDNDVASFTFGAEKTASDTEWHLSTDTITATGVKYIAIKYTSNDKWYLYIDNFVVKEKPETPTAIDNTEAADKAYKVVENGQVVIIRNGEKRTILGTKIQ